MSVWFPYLKEPNDLNKPCLICLYHAGGNANVFYRMLNIDSSVLAVPVELPGHGRRIREKMYTDLKIIAERLAAEIFNLFRHSKIYIYGHSFGSLIAYELCKRLEKEYKIYPEMLIVSGRNAPCDNDLSEFKYSMGRAALLKEMKRYGFMPDVLLDNKDFMKSFEPIIMGDYYMIEQYKYDGGEKIHAPVFLNYGESDSDISPERADKWGDITISEYSKKIYPGSHFFMFDENSSYFEDLINVVKKHSEK